MIADTVKRAEETKKGVQADKPEEKKGKTVLEFIQAEKDSK